MNVLIVGMMTGNLGKDRKKFDKYKAYLDQYDEINSINLVELLIDYNSKNVFKPPEISAINEGGWKWWYELSACISSLGFCEAIYLMPNWENCIFSIIMCLVAKQFGLKLLSHNTNGDLVCHNFKFSISSPAAGIKDFDNKSDNPAPAAPATQNSAQAIETSDASEQSDDEIRDWFRKQFPG